MISLKFTSPKIHRRVYSDCTLSDKNNLIHTFIFYNISKRSFKRSLDEHSIP